MKIGSGWKKEKDGEPWVSIVIEIPFLGKINVAMFKVKDKKSDASPDYDIVWSNMKKSNNSTDENPGF